MSEPEHPLGFLAPRGSSRDSGPTRETVLDNFLAFFQNALAPRTSPKEDTSRTDILIERALARPGRILDLCCGWPLLLEKLVEEHPAGGCNNNLREYLACDLGAATPHFKRRWGRLQRELSSKGCTCIRPLQPLPVDVTDTSTLKAGVTGRGFANVDVVLLANALHELSPLRVPDLFWTLTQELMAPGSTLLLLDPAPDWAVRAENWKVHDPSHLKVEWETHAVWLPPDVYSAALKELGCEIDASQANRPSQQFWFIAATKMDGSPRDMDHTMSTLRSMVQRAIDGQVQRENARYADMRDALAARFPDMRQEHHAPAFMSALHFLCVAASQARRLDVLSAMKAEQW